jgi:lysophospholipase L1-like esterase
MKPLRPALLLIWLLATGCADRERGAETSPSPAAPSSATTTAAATRPSSEPASRPALPFESEILAYERSDAADLPAADGIVFVGSSSIRLWKTLQEDFKGLPVINRGFGGSQVTDSVRYADRIVLPYRPHTVVLYAGDNDIAAGKSPQQVLADFQAFVREVHATLPRTRVLYIAIKPSVARWHLVDRIREANGLIEEFTRTDDRLGYIDVFTPMLGPDGQPRVELLVKDGLHLNPDGYALWKSILRPRLTPGNTETAR